MIISSLTFASKTQSKAVVFACDLMKILGCSIVIGLFAKISIPLPFTPVPLATQPHVILLLALVLGSKRAALATAAFVLEGAMGLPVFAGGKSGLLALAGPTGGYILGYIAAAYIAGFVFEKAREKTIKTAFLSMAAGNLAIYAFGVGYLSTFVGFKSAIALGMLPFLLGDALKLLASSKLSTKYDFFSR